MARPQVVRGRRFARADRPTPGTTIQKTSAILRSLADSEKEHLSFGEVIKATGTRAHAFGLLLFSLPETIPLPLPGVSAVIAVPIILISAHLIAYGEGPRLPQRVLRQNIPTGAIQKVSKYVSPTLERIERLCQPRLKAIASRERLLAVICLILGLILAAPIPFGNFAPAVGVAAIALGMLQRDGVLVLIGLGLVVVLSVGLYFAADALAELF
jgi:hypothetical protein